MLLKFDDGVCDIYHRHETSVGPDTWSEKNDNVSNILDFGNKINAETRLARWLNVNAGLRCQVYAVTGKVYNFL